MKYDMDKVRVACLKLMDYEPCRNPLDCAVDAHYHGPDWTVVVEKDAPNPTTSLDDALPLMEKFNIGLGLSGQDPEYLDEKWEAIGVIRGHNGETPYMPPVERSDSPALAICLCALRCAGRDLKDFET